LFPADELEPQEVLEYLRSHEKPEMPGVVTFPCGNGKQVQYLKVSGTRSDTQRKSRISELNAEIQTALELQGGGARYKEVINTREFKEAAREVLAIPGHLDVRATVDFKVEGGFTDAQLNLLRAAGLKMAGADAIKQEEERRSIPMDFTYKWFQADPRPKERHEVRDGKTYVWRRVMTTKLPEAISKLLGNSTKEVRWDNVPEKHSSNDAEMTQSILKMQQLRVLIHQLEITSTFMKGPKKRLAEKLIEM